MIYNWTSDFLFFVLKMYVKLILPLFDQSRYWQQRSPDPSQKHHHHMSLGITSFCKKKKHKTFQCFHYVMEYYLHYTFEDLSNDILTQRFKKYLPLQYSCRSWPIKNTFTVICFSHNAIQTWLPIKLPTSKTFSSEEKEVA